MKKNIFKEKIKIEKKQEEKNEKTKKEISFFDIHKKIFNKEELTKEEIKKFSQFLFLRHISFDLDYFEITLFLSSLPKMDNEKFLKILYSLNWKKYYKYKSLKRRKEDEKISLIKKYFNVSFDKAIEYKNFLNDEDYKIIKDKLGIE